MKTLATLFLVTLALNTLPGHGQAIEKGTEQKAFTPDLKAGDYVWQPEVSPSGPVSIVISLSDQLLYVYRNGVRIGRSTISSGKDGHNTPTGFFTILEKNVVHHSNVYQEASMPFMERLTWGGVAIHAGNLPGYPESHGCVHVPMDFAKKLYEVTEKGTTVIVTDAPSDPNSEPGLIFPAQEHPASGTSSWTPEASLTGPISIILSTADRQICAYRNGIEIGRATVGGNTSLSLGNHVYTALAETTPDGHHQWSVLANLDHTPPPDIQKLREQIAIPADFSTHLREIVTAGTTLLITNQPLTAKGSANE